MLLDRIKKRALFADSQDLIQFSLRDSLVSRQFGGSAVPFSFLVDPVFDRVHLLAVAVMDIDLSSARAVVGFDDRSKMVAFSIVPKIRAHSASPIAET
jgi:hypothetical protein